MSYYTTEPPVETPDSHGRGSMITHPCFGAIGAYRVSGHARLHASDFHHQHYVVVRIKTAEVRRDLSNDWHHGRKELIEVAMSEAQWASFVSAMNIGDGVPCTLQHVACERVPQLPEPKPRSEQFGAEMKRHMAERVTELGAIAAELKEAISKRKAAELMKRIEHVRAGLGGTTKFIAEQFDEHMEATAEKARIEVNAFVTQAVQRAGIDAIAAGQVLRLGVDKPEDKQGA